MLRERRVAAPRPRRRERPARLAPSTTNYGHVTIALAVPLRVSLSTLVGIQLFRQLEAFCEVTAESQKFNMLHSELFLISVDVKQ